MKTISLKIDDDIFIETEELLSQLDKPRNRYINEAIKFYNGRLKRMLISKALKLESELVSDENMKVLKEFEDIDYED